MPTVNKVQRPWIRKTEPAAPAVGQGRSNPNRELYGSNRWRVASERFREAHPLCEECLKSKTLSPSKVTDHRVPFNSGTVDFWDESNWVGLCVKCHNAKSAKERNR